MLNWVAEPRARRSMRRMRRIALVIDTHPALCERLLQGAASAPRPRGGAFLRMFSHAPAASALEQARAWSPDGVIAHLGVEDLERAVAFGLPLVAMVEDACQVATDAVLTDEEAVGAAAARHLLGRGLRHFAFLAQRRGGIAREQGWNRALAASGCATASLRLDGVGDDAGALRRWLAGLPRPLGLFCYNDILGLEALEACHALGLAVPSAVAVVGADDLPLGLGSDPPLSSVQVPHQALAREAAGLLYALLDRRSANTRLCLPPGGVAVRASSDASAIDDEVAAAAMSLIRVEARRLRSIDALATRLGVPRRTLERRFRQAIGRSPLEELRRTRIELARQALATGKNPTSAAESAGFRSMSAFQRAFAAQVGCSPGAYVRRYAAS